MFSIQSVSKMLYMNTVRGMCMWKQIRHKINSVYNKILFHYKIVYYEFISLSNCLLWLHLPHSDVVHLHGGLLSVVLVWVPGGVPLTLVVPEVPCGELWLVIPGFGVGGVPELVREEAHTSHSYIQYDEKLEKKQSKCRQWWNFDSVEMKFACIIRRGVEVVWKLWVVKGIENRCVHFNNVDKIH